MSGGRAPGRPQYHLERPFPPGARVHSMSPCGGRQNAEMGRGQTSAEGTCWGATARALGSVRTASGLHQTT